MGVQQMSNEQKFFKVTVRGQYQSLHEGSGVPTLKGYEETFDLPSQEAALSTICKHLLSPRLKKKYPDFIRYRTHELVGIQLFNYSPNKDVLQMGIDDMNILELHDFCILRQLMIDPYKHADKDIFVLRTMVQKAYTEKRVAEKERSQSKEGAEAKAVDKLRAQNDLPPAASDPVINLNEQKQTLAAKKASTAAPTVDTNVPAEEVESMDPLPEPEPDVNEPNIDDL